MNPGAGALAGVRVLDISSFLAAPQVATFLGDFGADVIKVEPPSGEALRRIGAARNGESLVWAMVSRNKRVITCDLNRSEGRDILRQLVAEVDVLVHNYSPTVLQRWDCTWDRFHAINPGLIMVSVSPYGHTGPLADRPGAGTMAEAFAGLTHMTGEAGGPPMLTSIPLGDTLTGVYGMIGALVACYGRDVNGLGGQHVDVSMYEPILTLMGSTLAAWDPDGDDPPPARFGSRLATGVPRNIYRTADNRYLCLSGTTDRQVERILALAGRDGPGDRAKFARMADRLAHNDELDTLVGDWVAQHSLDEAIAILVEARIPVAPVNDLSGLLVDAQVRARNSITLVAHNVLGTVPMATPAPVLSETPGAIRHPGPPVGAHNAEVYAALLGWDTHRLAQAQAEGII
ncbi:CaiB/BaiF CoA transferase family protein [Candidatus Poriferisocius sp.]|uniref:CaiB/BaiF CoA transferase family protein n=1 Tax=Candidatus Poriferisocius sp. TaxID=3101276 RepID=UPI003B020AE5